MTVVSKQEWIQAGLNQLREFGCQAISGEKLARRLDVTRGSFYHHFKSMDDYVEQLMDEWEQSYTLEKLEKAHSVDPWQEMTRLLEMAWNSDINLEVAVRQWGFSHPLVQKRVERIDSLRLGHISNLYGILVSDPVKGRQLGTIAYYGLLGALHASPRPTKAGLKELILEIQTLLMSGL
jgi:AcrR family transcriptional regulator